MRLKDRMRVKRRLDLGYLIHAGEKDSGILLCGGIRRLSDLSTKWWDASPYNNYGTIANGTWTRLSSGLWVQDFNGTSTKITMSSAINAIQSFVAWVYVDVKAKSIADFDAGTHSIETDATPDLTATGWAAPTFYVNGAASASMATGAWKHIGVTTATAFNGTAVILGDEASFFDGKMALVKIYNRALSATEISTMFNNERHLFQV